MAYLHDGNVTTYEWSVQPYDHFPDKPTQLFPGKHLGLDVAVVDKDADASGRERPPRFLTWGSVPRNFKGGDAQSLGELILVASPVP